MISVNTYLEELLYQLISQDKTFFNFIQNNAPDGLWVWDIKMPDNQWLNPKLCSNLGYSSDDREKMSDSWKDYIEKDSLLKLEEVRNEIEKKSIDIPPFVLQYKHTTSYPIWFNCHFLPVIQKNEVIALLGGLTDVTKYKKKDLSLLEQVKRYEHIIEGTNIGAWEWNIQTGETIFNEQWANVLGYSLEEIRPTSPETWHKFAHPEDKDKCDLLLEAHLEGKTEFYESEARMKHKNGEWVWVADKGKVVSWTADGKPEWMTGFHEEITPLKKAYERTKLFIEQAPSAIAMFDRRMNYLAVSQRWIEDNNIEDKDIIGKSHYEVNPDIPQRWKETHKRGLRGEVIRKEEDYFKRADGRELWISWEIRPWYTEEKKIGGIIMHTMDITRMKNVERINRERQAFLEAILGNIDVGIISCDAEGKLTLFNEATRDWHGLPPVDIPPSKFPEYYGLYKSDGVTPLNEEEIPLIKTLKQGSVQNEEMIIKPKKAPERILSVTGTQLKDENGNISGAVVALHDISKRKQAEEKLRISERAFRGNFENAAIGMAILDLNGQWLEVNDTLCEIVGYPSHELKKLTFQDITHPEDLEADLGLLNELVNGKRQFYHMEKRYFHKNGHIVNIILSVSLVRDTSSNPLYFIAQITDVTAQKKAERKLKETLAKFESILDASTQVSIIGTNEEGVISVFNKGAENLLGYKSEEVVDKEQPVIFHLKKEVEQCGKELFKETGKKIKNFEVFRELAKNQRHDTREWTYLKKDGTIFPVQLTVTAIREKDEVVGYLGIAVNISEIKKVEKEIKSLLKVTSDQNDRLKNFAHIVSHNLRSHSGNLAMLLDLYVQENPDAADDEMIQHLKTASENLRETITHLNEVVLINTSVNDNLISLNLKDAIEQAKNNIAAIASKAQVKIENNVTEDINILGLPAYLDSIILNFLTNGIKYRNEEKESYIRLSSTKEKNHVVLNIEDNGLGIDLEKNRKKLFGMYKTFHSHKDARGIGLFITKNQIEALGGRINVESEPGKGTCFKIYFKYEKN